MIDEAIVSVVKKELTDLKVYKRMEINKTIELGEEGILYWQEKINSFQKLSKEDAIKLLIKAEKIEAKIRTIEKTINLKISL